MALTIGTQLGSHEITALLGKGGMGEVYRARDLKLKREVAIKILPDEFSRDAERVSRFQREAELLASLNHPNIASIYDVEEANGSRFLVLELVEGETLADRIARGPIPVEEALDIAKHICEALEAAHDKGVIHRDLKPANIKLTRDGQVKVLDFGLAKPLQEQQDVTVSNSPTMMTASMPGVILGTPGYLSPEQARGKTVDKRTDIWGFGCVLFELLTRRQVFSGETLPDVMAAILSREANWNILPEQTPAKARQLLFRCLEKDLRRRLRDAGDARLEIEDAIHELKSPPPSAEGASSHAANRNWVPLLLAASVVVLAAVVVWLAAGRRPDSVLWSASRLGGPNVALHPRVSPDGRLVAVLGFVNETEQVGVINPQSGDWTILTHDKSRGYLSNVSWAPDGSKIYYGRIDGVPRGIFTVPALGGSERLVLEDATTPEALPDGSLLTIRLNPGGRPQLYRFWPETSNLESYPVLTTGTDWQSVIAFRDGKEAVFWGKPADEQESGAPNDLYAIDLSSKKMRRLTVKPDLGLYAVQFPSFALTPDDQSVLVKAESGDLHTIVAIPRNGGNARALFSTTDDIYGFDAAKDGSIYVDQNSRPFEVLRLALPTTAPEKIVSIGSPTPDFAPPPLPDGSVIVQSVVGGRSHLLIAKAGMDPMPFLQTSEETTGPAALVGTGELVFLVGNRSQRKAALAIASIADGRILRRLTKVDATEMGALGAAPDGQTLYYTANGRLWSVPGSDGEPHMIRQGVISFAVDPKGKYIVVESFEKDGAHLIRVPLDGGAETPLSFPGVRLASALTPNAVRSDGAIVAPLAVGNYNWALGLLHPDTGKVDRLPIDPSFDVHEPGFLPDGRIIVAGYRSNGSIWRFTPHAE
jgi:serine/threonine protein kinase